MSASDFPAEQVAFQAPDSSAGRGRRLWGLARVGGRRLLAWLVLPLTLAGGTLLLARSYQIPSVETPSPLSITLIAVLTVLVILGAVAAAYFILAGTDWNRSLRQLYLVVTASLAANYSTPVKAGIPLRVYLYKRFMGIGLTTGSALVVLELLLGMLVPAVISLFALVLILPGRGPTVPALVAAGVAVALVAIAFARSGSYDRAIVRLPLPGIARRALAPGGDIVTAVRSVPLSSLGAAAGIYAAMFVLVGVRSFYAFQLFGGSMNVIELVGIVAAAFTLGSISLLPMGIGVRDATLVALFVQAGAARDTAIAVAALDRLLSTGVPLLLGVLSAQVLGLRAILRTEDSTLDERGNGDPEGRGRSAPQPIFAQVKRRSCRKRDVGMGHNWAGAPGTLQSYGPRFISRRRLIRRLVKAVGPNRSLDIGCGSGLITKVLAEASAEVVAVDVSEEAIDVSRRTLGEATTVHLKAVDVFNSREVISDWKESFDLVVLSEVLEHIPDDEGALATVCELLGERGWLVLTVPGDPKLWNVEDERAGHARRYTREELHSKLTENGFEIHDMINWGFPLTKWLYRLEVRLMERDRLSRRNGKRHRLAVSLPLLALARPFLAVLADVESMLSRLDRGVGYVVLARKATAWKNG